jgi:hypothetical protein
LIKAFYQFEHPFNKHIALNLQNYRPPVGAFSVSKITEYTHQIIRHLSAVIFETSKLVAQLSFSNFLSDCNTALKGFASLNHLIFGGQRVCVSVGLAEAGSGWRVAGLGVPGRVASLPGVSGCRCRCQPAGCRGGLVVVVALPGVRFFKPITYCFH